MVSKTLAHKYLPEHFLGKKRANNVGVDNDKGLNMLRRVHPPAWHGNWALSLLVRVGTGTYFLKAEG